MQARRARGLPDSHATRASARRGSGGARGGLGRALALAALLLAGCGEEPAGPAAHGPASGGAAPVVAAPPAPRPDEPRLGPYPRSQFYIEHDLFLAADEPRVVPADQAAFLTPSDEVLGLIVGGAARAYPVTMLSFHHVVNDVIEGIPVAVTY